MPRKTGNSNNLDLGNAGSISSSNSTVTINGVNKTTSLVDLTNDYKKKGRGK